MSSDNYGLQDTEFRTKTIPIIINEMMDTMSSLMGGRVSLQEDDVLYQFLLVMAQREERLWRLADTMFQLMSISGSSGLALDRHGEDLGIERGGASRATGNVLVTGAPGNEIPIGSIFQTSDGIQFQTSEPAELPLTIEVSRSATGLRDSLTSPYSNLVVVDWISDAASGEGAYAANLDYIIDGDVIDWTPAGLQPDASAIYYVRVSEAISVTVGVESVDLGSGENVPANTITELISDVGGVTSTTNVNSTGTTGADAESHTSYRLRELRAPRRNWTIERIRSKVEEIDGVDSAIIFVSIPVDQSNIEETNTLERETVGQVFEPGERIGAISAADLNVRVFGTPGDLMLELFTCQRDATATIDYDLTLASTRLAYSRIAPTDIDPYRTTDWFEHSEDLKYNHLDNTKKYMLIVRSLSSNATNYYELRYGTSGTYSGNGLFRDGVLFSDDNLWFKTRYSTPHFTSVVSPTDTLTDTLTEEIEDSITESGRSVGTQHVVEEATQIRIQVTGRLKIDEDNYTISEISDGIETRIFNYINELAIGDDVVWALVMWCITEEPGIKDVNNVQIGYKRPEETTFTVMDVEDNVIIAERERAKQDTVGVIFEQFWSGD